MKKIRAVVDVALTPEQLADIFWALTDEEQAEFFNHLGYTAGSSLFSQLFYAVKNENLNDVGKQALRDIGTAVEEIDNDS